MKFIPFENNNGTYIKDNKLYVFKDVTNSKITGPKSNDIIEADNELNASIIGGFTLKDSIDNPIIEIDIQSLKLAKKDEIANERWKAEVSGIELNGMQILTDFNTQSKITAAYIYAFTDSNFTIDWKCANGFVTLNAQQIMMIGNAIKDHVQFQFTKEKNLLELLDNAETEEQINNIKW
jgi:hypothetical protein